HCASARNDVRHVRCRSSGMLRPHPLPLPVAIAITCRILDANTQRSAVYTCGVMLWELLTGRAFARDDDGRAVRVRAIRDRCPSAVEEIVTLATSLDFTATFASPAAMSSALAAAVQPAAPRAIEEWFAKAG